MKVTSHYFTKSSDVNKAVKYQTQAVEKSKSMIVWHQNKHKQYLDEYIEKLNDVGE